MYAYSKWWNKASLFIFGMPFSKNMLDTSVTHFLLTKQSLIYLHNFTFPDLLFNLNRCGISELCFTILPIFVMHSLFGPSIFLCLFFFFPSTCCKRFDPILLMLRLCFILFQWTKVSITEWGLKSIPNTVYLFCQPILHHRF